MKKILEKKWIIYITLGLLFLFTIIISTRFFNQQENLPEVSIDPIVLPSEEELLFTNNTDFTKEEILEIVMAKKNELRNLFYESNVYNLKDIDSSKTDEENEKYTVFDEQFLKKLDSLVTEDIYYEIFNKMILLKNDHNHTFYMMEKNAFDSIYLESAIAEVDIKSNELRLIEANEDKINASVTLVLENDNQKVSVPFELQKINNEWKVSVFELKKN